MPQVIKLVNATALDEGLTNIADAIREKGGTIADLTFPSGFVSAVEAIPTGGVSWDDIATHNAPDGDIHITGTSIDDYGLAIRATKDWRLFAPNVTSMGTSPFNNSKHLTEIYLPKLTTTGYQTFYYCINTELIDFGLISSIPNGAFQNTALKKLILRKNNAVVTLSNTNVFNNSPFASGGSGGTLYVPSALIASYQTASNWSTILGYANNSIVALEGSPYETPIT